ncbi:MAG: 23S rRNA (guanosine(2251)-2'-O)-methyltransferase RlmB [Desulfobacterota bacterium]|nr:23S rRNA (guanosine(2251)-2'-O)-methyltransferase RlmB [Thermodesulfobacteriota bacterium]
MMLYGIHPVTAVLRKRPHDVRRVVLARRHHDPAVRPILDACRQHRIKLDDEDPKTLDRITGSTQHQGVLADVAPFPLVDIHDAVDRCRSRHEKFFFLVLDEIQDPQNVGALIRSAVCAGVQAVIFPKDRAAPLTPVVAKASAGAIEEILLCRVVNITATLNELKKDGIWIVGTSPQAHQHIYEFDFDRDLAVVIGSEGQGMRPLVTRTCDALVAIPLHGACPSLNAAAAGAVVLFEALRQRRYTKRGG